MRSPLLAPLVTAATGVISITTVAIYAAFMILLILPRPLAAAGSFASATFSPAIMLLMLLTVLATTLAGIQVSRRRGRRTGTDEDDDHRP